MGCHVGLFLSKGNSPSKSPGSASPWCGSLLSCFAFCPGKKPLNATFPPANWLAIMKGLKNRCPFIGAGYFLGARLALGRLRFP